MGKYVIKRKIPKYQDAGEVDPVMPGNIVGLQGLGVEPLVSSTRIGFDIQQPDINTIDTLSLTAIRRLTSLAVRMFLTLPPYLIMALMI